MYQLNYIFYKIYTRILDFSGKENALKFSVFYKKKVFTFVTFTFECGNISTIYAVN